MDELVLAQAHGAEKKKTAESCTKTMLRGHTLVKKYIYELVNATSEIEALGNLVYTHALL
jgi:hypothetical protein